MEKGNFEMHNENTCVLCGFDINSSTCSIW